MGGGLVHVAVHVEGELAVAQGHGGDVHADGAVAGGAGEDRHAVLVGGAQDAGFLEAELLFAGEHVAAQEMVEFVGAHRALELGALNDLADKSVGVEEHVVGKQHVIDADDAVVAEHHVVHEWDFPRKAPCRGRSGGRGRGSRRWRRSSPRNRLSAAARWRRGRDRRE